jgi:hypothetical protein
LKIESLKDLKAVIKLCRSTGVDSITVDGVELKLGSEPEKPVKKVKRTAEIESIPDFIDMPDELTPEQLLYYSSQGFIPTDETI